MIVLPSGEKYPSPALVNSAVNWLAFLRYLTSIDSAASAVAELALESAWARAMDGTIATITIATITIGAVKIAAVAGQTREKADGIRKLQVGKMVLVFTLRRG